MFEARLASAVTLKRVIDAIKDLVENATFYCNGSGIQVIWYIKICVLFFLCEITN